MRKTKRLFALLLAMLLCLSLLPAGVLADDVTEEMPAAEALPAEEPAEEPMADAPEEPAEAPPEEPAEELPEEEPSEELAAEPEEDENAPEETPTGDAEELPTDGAAPAVTRAQWISALVETFSMTVEEDNYPDNYYPDISEADDFYRDILVAVEFGVIDLEYGEAFRPNDAATQRFAVSTLVYCLGFYPEEGDVTEAYSAQIAVNRGWVGTYSADSELTAAQKTVMLADAEALLAEVEVDEGHDNAATFADGVVVFPSGTMFEPDEEEDVVTIYDTSVPLETGDVFVLYYGDLPIAVKAASVTKADGSYIVAYTAEGAEGAIIDMDYSGSVELGVEGFAPTDGLTYVTQDGLCVEESATAFELVTDGKTVNAGKDLHVDRMINAGSMTAVISASMKNIRLKYSVKTNGFGVVDSVTLKLISDTSISTTVTGSYSGGTTANSVSIGSAKFLLIGKIGLSLDYSLEGRASLDWNGTTAAGFSYSPGSGFRLIREFTKKSFTATARVDVKVGLTEKASFDLKVIKGETWVSVGIQGRYRAAVYDGGTPGNCQDVEMWLYAEDGSSVSIATGFDFTKWRLTYNTKSREESVYSYSNSPFRVHYHWEDGSSVDSCTRPEDFASSAGNRVRSYYTKTTSNHYNPGTYTPVLWSYELNDDGNAVITAYLGSGGAVEVPETIDGHTVVAIGDKAFQDKTGLRTVSLPDMLTQIGALAFEGCSGLRTIALPAGLTSIGSAAFNGCSSLKSVFVPRTVTTMYGFYIGMTNTGDYGAFYNSGVEEVVFEEGMEEIPMYALHGATELTDVTIPKTVTQIGDYAFCDCYSLETVELPSALTTIGMRAFLNCTSLNSLTLPKSLQNMGAMMFSGCTSLKSITIPRTVTNMKGFYVSMSQAGDYGALYGSSVEEVIFETGRSSIPDYALNGVSSVKTVVIPKTVTKIGRNAFDGCSSLVDITIPSVVTSIGQEAFLNCTSLKKISIPGSVKTVGGRAFSGCTALEEVDLHEGLTDMGYLMFYNCESLRSITIPSTVTSMYGMYISMYTQYYSALYGSNIEEVTFAEGMTYIPDHACEGAWDLKTLNIPASADTTGYMMCSDCVSLETVVIPDTVTSMYAGTFNGCTKLHNVTLPATRVNIMNNTFSGCTALEEITLPRTVEYIRESAFENCTSLKTIHWSDAPKEIETNAFKGCTSLTSVVLPDTITTIGEDAFRDCTALESVVLPTSLESFDIGVFYQCEALAKVDFGGASTIPDYTFKRCYGLESITVPNTVTSIGYEAFALCTELTKITIPRSVTSISDSAFSYPEDITIYGFAGSYAETYAAEHEIAFVALEEIPGDANGDGTADAFDASLILLAQVGLTRLPDPAAADADGDELVTPADAAALLRGQ